LAELQRRVVTTVVPFAVVVVVVAAKDLHDILTSRRAHIELACHDKRHLSGAM
jgi:hypothetical protein